MSELTEAEKAAFEAALKAVQRPGDIWSIRPEVHDFFEARGFHIMPRHFYSPVPAPELTAGFDYAAQPFPLEAIQFNRTAWGEILADVGRHAGELMAARFPALGGGGYPWVNDFYTGLDAFTLYAMVRRARPHRLIEIGSGYSTHVALAAMRANGSGRITCIEPYPSPVLRSLGGEIELIEAKAQSVDAGLFESLRAGDILFIDSSHMVAFQSDVVAEVLRVLPRLQPGVLVHFHDIFVPWDYPREWVAERRWYWTEQYLLYAAMLENPHWELIMPTYYTWNAHGQRLADTVGKDLPFLFNGCSIWFRRLA